MTFFERLWYLHRQHVVVKRNQVQWVLSQRDIVLNGQLMQYTTTNERYARHQVHIEALIILFIDSVFGILLLLLLLLLLPSHLFPPLLTLFLALGRLLRSAGTLLLLLLCTHLQQMSHLHCDPLHQMDLWAHNVHNVSNGGVEGAVIELVNLLYTLFLRLMLYIVNIVVIVMSYDRLHMNNYNYNYIIIIIL